jgi:pyruvate/2-oxoglutarate dehydrogenase complex dihydrolipoamide acyltransferase (E2) component
LAAAKALKEHSIINSSVIDNEIKLWEDINIGVAVALDEGLIVPVIKNADKKSLVEISQTRAALVEKARAGKLVPDEVTGGTFTISNLGALETGGYRFETVIINQPESAILGTGRVTDRVVARDGQIVVRPIMTYYFTYDHRVIVGAVAAEFLSSLTQLLENPSILLA